MKFTGYYYYYHGFLFDYYQIITMQVFFVYNFNTVMTKFNFSIKVLRLNNLTFQHCAWNKNHPNIIAAFDLRYNNSDTLSQAYQQDLQAVPVSMGDWRQKRSTLDTIVKLVNNLESIGEPVNESNVRMLVIQKFPESTIIEAYYMRLVIKLCSEWFGEIVY